MNLETIFRTYDIRGEYGTQLTALITNDIAKSFVTYAHPKSVVVGMDCRISSPEIKQQLVEGLLSMGVNVTDIGMVSTDVLYFATWNYHFDGGIMVTASHMPPQYNGLKFLRLNSQGMLSPIGKGDGMEELEAIYNQKTWQESSVAGQFQKKDVWADFVHFTTGFVNVKKINKFNIVMDAGNGMGGIVAEKIFSLLDLNIQKMYFEPDGTFPNHPANPLVPENRSDIVTRVKETHADLGVAWDADCDRVYFIDEKGEFVNGDFIVALLAIYFLKSKPRSNIVYDLRCTDAVPQWITKFKGVAHVEKVGHSYIKKRMLETKSIFGGELSGHYYFANNAYMENGFAPVLIILELMSERNKKLSELIKELGDYYVSGEINFTVKNVADKIKQIENKYNQVGVADHLDGISYRFSDWHFNVRPSANDPVLRLNLEANSQKLLDKKMKELSDLLLE